MPGIKIIVAITIMLIYLRWEFLSPFVNQKTGKKGTKLQIILPFLGFLCSAILVQLAVNLDSMPESFVLLALGALSLVAGASYGMFRRFRR
jgi:hypothetical protein